MIITRGGKEYVPSEASPFPKRKDMSHAAFVLWEAMIGLQLERGQAIEKHERMERLYEKADANPDHPNIGKVYARIESLRKEIERHQKEFLDYEEIFHREWYNIGSSWSDDAMLAAEMYNLDSLKSTPSLWNHPLGESSTLPPFSMSTTALQFASPALARKYQGGRRS